MDKRKKLATLSVMYQGDWDTIAKALQDDVQAIDIPIKDSYITDSVANFFLLSI